MLMFREEKSPEDEIKAWQFWHSRQHSVKQRILDAGKLKLLRERFTMFRSMIGHDCHNFYGTFRAFPLSCEDAMFDFMDVRHASSARCFSSDYLMIANYLLCNNIRRTLMTTVSCSTIANYKHYTTDTAPENNSRLLMSSRFQLSTEDNWRTPKKVLTLTTPSVGCVKNPPAGLRATISFGCTESMELKIKMFSRENCQLRTLLVIVASRRAQHRSLSIRSINLTIN